jgi:hypothetical protein
MAQKKRAPSTFLKERDRVVLEDEADITDNSLAIPFFHSFYVFACFPWRMDFVKSNQQCSGFIEERNTVV